MVVAVLSLTWKIINPSACVYCTTASRRRGDDTQRQLVSSHTFVGTHVDADIFTHVKQILVGPVDLFCRWQLWQNLVLGVAAIRWKRQVSMEREEYTKLFKLFLHFRWNFFFTVWIIVFCASFLSLLPLRFITRLVDWHWEQSRWRDVVKADFLNKKKNKTNIKALKGKFLFKKFTNNNSSKVAKSCESMYAARR